MKTQLFNAKFKVTNTSNLIHFQGEFPQILGSPYPDWFQLPIILSFLFCSKTKIQRCLYSLLPLTAPYSTSCSKQMLVKRCLGFLPTDTWKAASHWACRSKWSLGATAGKKHNPQKTPQFLFNRVRFPRGSTQSYEHCYMHWNTVPSFFLQCTLVFHAASDVCPSDLQAPLNVHGLS